MPRTQSATLTEAELRIMQVLWDKGSATVQQVLEALPRKKPLAYNSVLTIVRILEKKGEEAAAQGVEVTDGPDRLPDLLH